MKMLNFKKFVLTFVSLVQKCLLAMTHAWSGLVGASGSRRRQARPSIGGTEERVLAATPGRSDSDGPHQPRMTDPTRCSALRVGRWRRPFPGLFELDFDDGRWRTGIRRFIGQLISGRCRIRDKGLKQWICWFVWRFNDNLRLLLQWFTYN